jgi:hypothetical protein
MKYLVLITLYSFLVGCAGHVTVKIPLQEVQNGNLLARVKVNDLRTPGVASSTREAAFGVPMGNITFDPPEEQIVKNLLEVELTKILREKGIQSQQDYVCDLLEFGVNTDTTPLYWDVIGRILLVLKQNGKKYNLFGKHLERTYVWPGESVIKKVVDESLQQIVAGLRQIS